MNDLSTDEYKEGHPNADKGLEVVPQVDICIYI